MKEHVWQLTTEKGPLALKGNVVFGPLVFTSYEAAVECASQHDRLSRDATPHRMDSAVFLQEVMKGFPDVGTDAFLLDELAYPLSEKGAAFVDGNLTQPFWGALFKEEAKESVAGFEWFREVLMQVSSSLDMSDDVVAAIASLNAAREDAEVENQDSPAQSIVEDQIQVIMTPEPKKEDCCSGECNCSSSDTFWMHTIGMEKFGQPDFEFRDVPAQWATEAGLDLKQIAKVAIQDGMEEGCSISKGGPLGVILRTERSTDPFWRGQPCLRITLAEATLSCAHYKCREQLH